VDEEDRLTAPPAAPPALAGTAFCLLSAVLYTVSNACLKQLAGEQVPAAWAICVKESVSVLVLCPWLAWHAARGTRLVPGRWAWWLLAAVGLVTELGGNVLQFWGFGVIGMAAAVPLSLACILIGAAVLGWIWLKERVSPRSAVAITLLIVAVALLTSGASQASQEMATTSTPLRAALGVAATCAAGLIFALLSTVIRFVTQRGVAVTVVMVMVTGMGVVSLGPYSFATQGARLLTMTSAWHWALMLAAGVANLLAFAAAIRGLHLITVVHFNAVNIATQTTLSALVALAFLGEPITLALAAGIALIIAGVKLVDRGGAQPQQA